MLLDELQDGLDVGAALATAKEDAKLNAVDTLADYALVLRCLIDAGERIDLGDQDNIVIYRGDINVALLRIRNTSCHSGESVSIEVSKFKEYLTRHRPQPVFLP